MLAVGIFAGAVDGWAIRQDVFQFGILEKSKW
jgi:hypothetical protein